MNNPKFILVKGNLTQIQTTINQWGSTGYTVEIAGPLVKKRLNDYHNLIKA